MTEGENLRQHVWRFEQRAFLLDLKGNIVPVFSRRDIVNVLTAVRSREFELNAIHPLKSSSSTCTHLCRCFFLQNEKLKYAPQSWFQNKKIVTTLQLRQVKEAHSLSLNQLI